MPKHWLPLIWRLALSLGLVLGPGSPAFADSMTGADAASGVAQAMPPCHGDATDAGAAPADEMPCCDGPCLGCAPVLCGPGPAAALPVSVSIAARERNAYEPPIAAEPVLVSPPPRERLRPPIA